METELVTVTENQLYMPCSVQTENNVINELLKRAYCLRKIMQNKNI